MYFHALSLTLTQPHYSSGGISRGGVTISIYAVREQTHGEEKQEEHSFAPLMGTIQIEHAVSSDSFSFDRRHSGSAGGQKQEASLSLFPNPTGIVKPLNALNHACHNRGPRRNSLDVASNSSRFTANRVTDLKILDTVSSLMIWAMLVTALICSIMGSSRMFPALSTLVTRNTTVNADAFALYVSEPYHLFDDSGKNTCDGVDKLFDEVDVDASVGIDRIPNINDDVGTPSKWLMPMRNIDLNNADNPYNM